LTPRLQRKRAFLLTRRKGWGNACCQVALEADRYIRRSGPGCKIPTLGGFEQHYRHEVDHRRRCSTRKGNLLKAWLHDSNSTEPIGYSETAKPGEDGSAFETSSCRWRQNWIHIGSEQAGPRVAAIVSIIETCRRLKIRVRDYLGSILLGLANLPASRIAEVTPTAWACRN